MIGTKHDMLPGHCPLQPFKALSLDDKIRLAAKRAHRHPDIRSMATSAYKVGSGRCTYQKRRSGTFCMNCVATPGLRQWRHLSTSHGTKQPSCSLHTEKGLLCWQNSACMHLHGPTSERADSPSVGRALSSASSSGAVIFHCDRVFSFNYQKQSHMHRWTHRLPSPSFPA